MYKTCIVFLILIFNSKFISAKPHSIRKNGVQRAFELFQTIAEKDLFLYQKTDKSNCLIEGMITKADKDFRLRNIKSGKFWVWNQSNIRTIKNHLNYQVAIRKYSPKRRNPDNKNIPLPEFKMWRFDVTQDDQFIKTLFWTVKGITIEGNSTNIEKVQIPIVPVRLQDLAFLEHDMDPKTAFELFYCL